jgi:hypothetical protein
MTLYHLALLLVLGGGAVLADALAMISTWAAVAEKHHWIKFVRGHTFALAAVYEQAAALLEENLR